jgi:hypothetical protein
MRELLGLTGGRKIQNSETSSKVSEIHLKAVFQHAVSEAKRFYAISTLTWVVQKGVMVV